MGGACRHHTAPTTSNPTGGCQIFWLSVIKIYFLIWCEFVTHLEWHNTVVWRVFVCFSLYWKHICFSTTKPRCRKWASWCAKVGEVEFKCLAQAPWPQPHWTHCGCTGASTGLLPKSVPGLTNALMGEWIKPKFKDISLTYMGTKSGMGYLKTHIGFIFMFAQTFGHIVYIDLK